MNTQMKEKQTSNSGWQSIYLIVMWMASILSLPSYAQDGQLDATFNEVDIGFTNAGTSGPNNAVRASALQSDRKIIIGGQFTTYNGTARNRIARLNEDGTLDTSFDPGTGANSVVRYMAVQSDGKIIVAGDFTTFNGASKIALVRLNADGTLDTSFTPGTGPDGGVFKVVVLSSGKILIVGAFSNFNGTARSRIALLNADGSLDTSFNPGTGANNTIQAIAVQADGKIVVGGNFTLFNGTARNYLARLNADGSLDTSFDTGTGFNNNVQTLALQSNSKIIAGGLFTDYAGSGRNHIVRLNTTGTLDATFVGTGFDVGINTTIEASVALGDDKIVIGGSFGSYNGILRPRLVRLNADGSIDTGFTVGQGANNVIYTLSLDQQNNEIVIGGVFTQYNAITKNYIGRVNDNGSFDVGETGANGNVRGTALQNDGKVVVVGEFTTFNGRAYNRIVRLNANGSLDTSFNPGTAANSVIRSVVALANGKLLIVGDFSNYNGTAIIALARLNADGTLDNTFTTGTGPNGGVYSLAVQGDGKLLIAGVFTSYNGTTRNRIARLNSDGTLDTSFNPGTGANSVVRMIALQTDGKVLLAGDFSAFNGATRIGLLRLNSDGSLETGFVANTNLAVYAVALQSDNKILITGDFTMVSSTSINRIARLNSDGTVDPSFSVGTGLNLRANVIGLESDQQIIIAGEFATVNGTSRILIARLNTNGSLDPSFNPGTSADNSIFSLQIQSTGMIIGGSFLNYNGTARGRLARISVCAPPSITSTTPAARCDAGTVSLAATASAGTLTWYSALTGGSALGTGSSFITPAISTTTTYYVDATDNSCTSARTAVTATVNTTPSVTGSTPASRCGNGTVTLGATASSGTLNWYTASSGGTSQATGISFVTPSLSGTTTYYVDASIGGCTSARTSVVATVNTVPTITSTTPASRCDAGTVILGATGSAGTLNWYAALSGGTSLFTGAPFTTPSLTTTTTYYVDATANGCPSARSAVAATINTTPSITGSTPASRCGTGTLSLAATASAGTLNWYTASTGGSSQGTGATFATPSLSNTTTYYVDANNNGCTSARTSVIATVNTMPTVTGTTPSSRCDAGTITLGATASAGTLNWYAATSGGALLGTGTSFVTPSLTSTTTYYTDATANGCTSARTAVTGTINATPSFTSISPASRCDAGTVTLGAIASAGTINWFAVSSGGASQGSGTSFITPTLSTTTNYYAEATSNGCTSTRTAIAATINATPSITSTTPATRCGTGVVGLSAVGSAGTLYWFAASSGGTSLGSGIFFNTPSISSTTTYYVEANNGGCLSPRSSVVATVNTLPVITNTTPASRCDAGVVTLGASTTLGTLNWYSVATGGTTLGNGTSFITPSLSTTTTYYVDVTSNGCTSARTAVPATINVTPVISITTPATRCDAGTVVLGATTNAGTLHWYNVSTGGTSLGTGSSFTTPSLTSTSTYYVGADNNGCISTRSAVVATVNTTPAITGTTPGSRCGAGSISLGATADAGQVTWYDVSSGGTSLANGATFTPQVSSTATYYAEAIANDCASPRSAVVATINPVPTMTSTTAASRCDHGTLTLSATASEGTPNWFSTSAGGTSLFSGANFTTPDLSTTTIYYVETTSSAGCSSPRSEVIATINIVPVVNTTTPATRCGTGTLVLGGTASAGVLNWYEAATGGSSLGSGTTFTTPSLSTTTTYYVDALANGCSSVTRVPVIATVNAVPTVTSVTSGTAANCNSGSVELSAAASAGTLSWYGNQTGGTALATGTSFITPVLSITTNYYVEATANGCSSPRSVAIAAIKQSPPQPTITSNNTDPTAPVLTSSNAIGNQWFRDGAALSGATGATLVITQQGMYTVQTSLAGCASLVSNGFTYVVTAIEPGWEELYTIHPVPAHDELSIGLKGLDPMSTRLTIHDLTGRELFSSVAENKSLSIDLRDFSPGVYLITLRQGEKKIVQRFVKN